MLRRYRSKFETNRSYR